MPKTKEAPPAIVAPDTSKLGSETNSIAVQAKAITVNDETSYQQASALIDVGDVLLKEIGQTFDPLVASAHKLHKDLLSQKKTFTDPIEAALSAKKREMANWQMEQERLRRVEEARLAEIARKDAEALAVAEAALLAQQGDAQAAEEIIQQAIEAPTPTVVLPAFHSSDYGRRTLAVWRWELVDISKIPVNFLVIAKNAATGLMQDISTSLIGVNVRTLKNKEMAETMFKGGIKVWEDKSIS